MTKIGNNTIAIGDVSQFSKIGDNCIVVTNTEELKQYNAVAIGKNATAEVGVAIGEVSSTKVYQV